MATVIEGLGPATTIPQLRPGTRLDQLALGPEEGFVLSRIDGRTSLETICRLVPFDPGFTAAILRRLRALGVILLPGVATSPPQGGTSPPQPAARSGPPEIEIPLSADPSASPSRAAQPRDSTASVSAGPPPVDPAAAVPRGIDLSPEQLRRIDAFFVSLGTRDAFELLELARGAAPREVKRAYFRLSKEFHPDRYYGKEIGAYRERLSQVFLAIKSAFELLSDQERRAAYEESSD